MGLIWLLLATLSVDSDIPRVRQTGLASGYDAWSNTPKQPARFLRPEQRYKPGRPYCWYLGKVKRGDPIVAHRTLPCGTRVYVTRLRVPQRGAWFVVGDRGPWGACVAQRLLPKGVRWHKSPWCEAKHGRDSVWYVKSRPNQPGVWRGILDMSHEARRIIGHSGFELVTLRYGSRTRRTALKVAKASTDGQHFRHP